MACYHAVVRYSLIKPGAKITSPVLSQRKHSPRFFTNLYHATTLACYISLYLLCFIRQIYIYIYSTLRLISTTPYPTILLNTPTLSLRIRGRVYKIMQSSSAIFNLYSKYLSNKPNTVVRVSWILKRVRAKVTR